MRRKKNSEKARSPGNEVDQLWFD